MGYFGKSITSSDKYMDYEADLFGFLGVKYPDDDYKDSIELAPKEIFDERVNEIHKWMVDSSMDIEQGTFLAYNLLIRGVDVSNEILDKLINCFKDDDWAKEDLERKYYMNYAIKCLETYKVDKSPIDIELYYDFEKYYINKTHSIEEVTTIFTEILQTDFVLIRDVYSLYILIEEEDFDKFYNGRNLFGVKFLKKI